LGVLNPKTLETGNHIEKPYRELLEGIHGIALW